MRLRLFIALSFLDVVVGSVHSREQLAYFPSCYHDVTFRKSVLLRVTIKGTFFHAASCFYSTIILRIDALTPRHRNRTLWYSTRVGSVAYSLSISNQTVRMLGHSFPSRYLTTALVVWSSTHHYATFTTSASLESANNGETVLHTKKSSLPTTCETDQHSFGCPLLLSLIHI